MQDKKAVVLSTLLHIVFCFGFSPKLETLNGAEASACSVTVLLQPSSPPTPSQAHLSRGSCLCFSSGHTTAVLGAFLRSLSECSC